MISSRSFIDLNGNSWDFKMSMSDVGGDKPIFYVQREDKTYKLQQPKDAKLVSKTMMDAIENKDIDTFNELCKIANIKVFNRDFVILDENPNYG